MLGQMHIECLVEFSKTERRFFILTWDIFANKFHVLDLYLKQAEKMFKVCESDWE
jgi:hypothetical protein